MISPHPAGRASVYCAAGFQSCAAARRTVVDGDVAVANGNFKTFVTAIKAASLAETLSGKGPFTVFAPTDAAFATLPAGAVDALLKDIPKLKAILTNHVVSGAVMAKDVKTGMVPTVNGQSLDVKTDAMGVTVNGAKVTTADVKASNGVIHVIDTVVIPK